MTYTPSTGITSPFLESATSLPNSIEGEWSPSADQVAFMSTLGQGLAYGVQYEVFVADADGTDPRQVASNGLYPDWSPDGRQLVFEREDGLYVLDLSSGDEQRILEMPKIHYAPMPAWSP
jgi:Tol biopolymer transport system component